MSEKKIVPEKEQPRPASQDNLAQHSGSLIGQGDAVDTEDSPGAITETAGKTAGRRVDREPQVVDEEPETARQQQPTVRTTRPVRPA